MDRLKGHPPTLLRDLIEQESAEPDMDEIIRIPGLPYELAQFSSVRREALLTAGFVFLNKLGGGEKPIIDAMIPFGDKLLDVGSKVLLTNPELDAVFAYQRLHPDQFGTGNLCMQELREDMLAFLKEAEDACSNIMKENIRACRAALLLIERDRTYSDQDRQVLLSFFDYVQSVSGFPGLIGECVAGLDILTVRGIPIEVLPSRYQVLNGIASPFLNSGLHFGLNQDVTLYPNDPTRTRRLNMAVVHLLSRGLNEMGESSNSSHDQRYITSAEYIREVLSSSRSSSCSAGTLKTIATRLLVRAYIYADLPYHHLL